MRLSSKLIALSVCAMLLGPAVTSSAQEFDAIIGTWVLNVAKSEWGKATPPKSQVRACDYTHDGLILCTWRSVGVKGNIGNVHWYTKFDGQPRPEFSRGSQSTVSINLKKTGERTFDVEGKRLKDGFLNFKGTGTISADGKTLTWRVDDYRDNNTTVRIYEKETDAGK